MSCSAKVRRCLMEYYDEESWPDLALRYALAEDETVQLLLERRRKRRRSSGAAG